MRRIAFALALATSAAAVTAIAQTPPMRGPGGPGAMGLLMRADANGDGTVTRQEATAAADADFDRADANRDGKVTRDEMMAYRQSMRPMRRGGDGGPPPPADGSAPPPPPPPGAGPDGADGGMTREQFRARALAMFDRTDTNHDGKVDQAEMAAMRDMRRERRIDRGSGDAPPPPPPSGRQ